MSLKLTRGFTLVEVVVAISILSMIVLGTLAALRTFGRTQATLEDVSERTQSLRQVSGLLRRTLVDAQALPMASRITFGGIYFYGDGQKLVWVAPFSASRHLGGMTIFGLQVQEGDLLLSMAPYVDSQPVDESNLTPLVIAEEIESFSLAYRAEPGGEWVENWQEQPALPDSVRLTLMVAGRHWPDLIVRLNDASVSGL